MKVISQLAFIITTFIPTKRNNKLHFRSALDSRRSSFRRTLETVDVPAGLVDSTGGLGRGDREKGNAGREREPAVSLHSREVRAAIRRGMPLIDWNDLILFKPSISTISYHRQQVFLL